MKSDSLSLPLERLVGPAMRATEALVRLDERVARSPVGAGFAARGHFLDAAAALWIEGELVHIEDLVLHDAHMDLRAPTHELTRAHEILRIRRQIASAKPGWALSNDGLAALWGRGAAVATRPEPQRVEAATAEAEDTAEEDTRLDEELAALDAAMARAQILLDGVADDRAKARRGAGVGAAAAAAAAANRRPRFAPQDKNPLVYDADWNEAERLEQWKAVLAEAADLPPLLRATVLHDAWETIAPLQHAPWLGRLLVAACLRQAGTTGAHLPALNVGARLIQRDRRRARDRTTRLVAFIEGVQETASAGLKEHDRLMLAKTQMERRLKGRRSTSKLPDVIELVLSRPLVTSGIVEKELSVTAAGALNLIGELDLREITGRGRYRAWGIV